jgi:tetratricopeptide (TPR) repeat protein
MERAMHWFALDNWLRSCEGRLAAASGWEDVKGLVEASYHSQALGKWYMAYRLAHWPVGVAAVPLVEHLFAWGYFQVVLGLFEPLVGKVSPAIDLECFGYLAQAYRLLGDGQRSQGLYLDQLQLAQQRGALRAEYRALDGLGCLAVQQHRYKEASVYFRGSYRAALRLRDVEAQVNALCKVGGGLVCHATFGYQLSYLEQAAALAESVHNERLKMRVKLALGINYFWVKRYSDAQALLEQIRSPDYPFGEDEIDLRALIHLSLTYYFLGDEDAALAGFHEAFVWVKGTKNIFSEMFVLANMAVLLSQHQLDLPMATRYAERALEIAIQLHNQVTIVRLQAQLAGLYLMGGNRDRAAVIFRQAMVIYRHAQASINADERAVLLAYIAQVRWLRGERLWAISVLLRSFLVYPPWQNPNGQLILERALVTLMPNCIRRFVHWVHDWRHRSRHPHLSEI